MTTSEPSAIQKVAAVAGRFLLSAIFLMSGLGKIFDFEGTTGYMEAYGMPAVSLFLVGAIMLEVFGGVSLLLGLKARWGAALLIVFLVPTTLIFHQFWAVAADAKQVEMIMFMKNLAILGALFLVWVHGAGPASLDARWARQREQEESL